MGEIHDFIIHRFICTRERHCSMPWRMSKCMAVVDEFTRQGFEIAVGRGLTTGDVIDVLEKLFLEHGRPACLRSDNGPEMVSSTVQKRLKGKHVDTHYIDPGSPWQNGYCKHKLSQFHLA